MGVAYNPSIVTNGLVLYLDAANPKSYPGSGSAWNGLFGTAYSGTLNNAPTVAQGPTSFTLNGTTQDITTNYVNASINSTSFTMSGWFKTTAPNGAKIVGFENTASGTSSSAYDKHVWVTTGGNVAFGVYNTTYRTVVSSGTYNDGRWHNFAAVHTAATQIELFVDGVSQGSTPYVSVDSGTYFRIGSWWMTGWSGGANGYFFGSIGTVSLHHRALTADEVKLNFAALRGRYGQ